MQQDIHPTYHKISAVCVCGNTIETGSVLSELRVEICHKCHPLFTGTQKIVDTEGRIQRFERKYQKKQA